MTSQIQNFILNELKKLGITKPQEIARCIQRQSDFYIENPEASTPWDQKWSQVAQLAYYFPLNWVRNAKVYEEAQRIGFFQSLENFVEMGSGLGASTDHALKHLCNGICVEQDTEARNFHKNLHTDGIQWKYHLDLQAVTEKTLGVFSYVLTEVKNPMGWLQDFSSLLIVEPSTHEDARKLMQLRQNLIDEGYHIWGPCTHQGLCPLLDKSKKDWCHDRVHWHMPDWFQEIEKHLPIKNKTLTMSYLLASKFPVPKLIGKARAVGDLLKEKGKSRIMVCRGEEREFLSALKKTKIPLEHSRGDLVDIPENHEIKGNEIRLKV